MTRHDWMRGLRLLDGVEAAMGHRSCRRNRTSAAGFGGAGDQPLDVLPYLKATPKMFEHIRNTCGDDVELLHDVHERIHPTDAVLKGYLHVNEAPGFGVDLDEAVAAKYPLPEHRGYWEPVRRRDGMAVRQ